MSHNAIRAWAAIWVLPLLISAGCDALVRQPSTTAQELTDFSSTRLPGVSVAAVRPVAAEIFTGRYRLDTAQSTGNVLISRPLEVSERGDAEQAGVRERLSGAAGRRRQIAQIHLVERGNDVVVRCHVQVQRLDVAERGAFVSPRAADDRPGNLPAQRAPGTRTLTEDDWVDVGRDRQTERSMLNEISQRLEGSRAEG